MASLRPPPHQLRCCCCYQIDDAAPVVVALPVPSLVFETLTTSRRSDIRPGHSCRLPLFQRNQRLAKSLRSLNRQGSCTASVYHRRGCCPLLVLNGSLYFHLDHSRTHRNRPTVHGPPVRRVA